MEKITDWFTYGRSDSGNYAIARHINRSHGTWDACELNGDFYSIVEFDEIPEDDWDRIDSLEEQVKDNAIETENK